MVVGEPRVGLGAWGGSYGMRERRAFGLLATPLPRLQLQEFDRILWRSSTSERAEPASEGAFLGAWIRAEARINSGLTGGVRESSAAALAGRFSPADPCMTAPSRFPLYRSKPPNIAGSALGTCHNGRAGSSKAW